MEDSFIDPSWCYFPLFKFFNNSVAPKFQEGNKDLVASHVGRGKDSLDAVDSDIGVAEVVPLFGPFVKNTDEARNWLANSCSCMKAACVFITFVSCLGNVLWYIDGRHHVFSDRSFQNPVSQGIMRLKLPNIASVPYYAITFQWHNGNGLITCREN